MFETTFGELLIITQLGIIITILSFKDFSGGKE